MGLEAEAALAVTVQLKRPDGSVEQIQVGQAVRSAQGFEVKFASLYVAGTPVLPALKAAELGGTAPPAPVKPPLMRAVPNRPRLPLESHTTVEDLEEMAARARKALADPRKARWHEDERHLLEEIEAELLRMSKSRG